MTQEQNLLTMEYRGYTASVTWNDEAKYYYGRALDTWGTICFYDYTWEKAFQAFKDLMDEYLEECERDGEEPRLSNRELAAHSV